jgi:5-dehydro-2-deoxygluconokinase
VKDAPLLLLAIDHRASLERDLYGLTTPPTPAQAARISSDKLLVYESLLDALADLPEGTEPGILIDEEYGASVAELAPRTNGAVRLAMPIEVSGEQWFHFAYGDGWQAHAEFYGTDYAKVLVRDNPGLDPGEREAQASRLAEVSAWATAGRHRLIIELLVPATPSDLDAVNGDKAVYDRQLRPRLTGAAIEYLQDRDIEPAIWKIEGLDTEEDAKAIVATARRGGRTADCIVLGRHADHDHLTRWLRVAAPVPGFVGFAIGRSIWWDALSARLRQGSTDADTRRLVSSAYLDFARYYLAAATP